MSLDEYWRKRDFERTPEPRGAPRRRWCHPCGVSSSSAIGPPASTTTYAWRSVAALVSWAVPRGPSMRPLEKRRAARTEDHPLEYLDFEGVIPVGEYGAGDVIVWDHGALGAGAPRGPGRIDRRRASSSSCCMGLGSRGASSSFVPAALKVAMTGCSSTRRDAHAVEEWQIDEQPTSVLSGRTNEEVAARQATAISPDRHHRRYRPDGCPAASRPDFVEPMLATPVGATVQRPRLALRAQARWLSPAGGGG